MRYSDIIPNTQTIADSYVNATIEVYMFVFSEIRCFGSEQSIGGY